MNTKSCRLGGCNRRWPGRALPFLAILGCYAGAQSDGGPGVALPLRAAPARQATGASPADLEGCRADLLQTLALYREVLRTEDGRRRVDGATALLDRLGPRDMEVIASACSQVGQWKKAAAAARDAVLRGATSASAAAALATSTLPGAPYSDLCGSTRSNTEAIFATQVALQVARGVWSAASRACEEVVVAACFGGNTSLVCIAADEALFVAEKALEDVKFCDEDIDSAEIRGTYDRVQFVSRQLEVVDQKLDALARAVEGLRLLGCDTIRLENTPEGQRASAIPVCSDQPGFPYGWPQR